MALAETFPAEQLSQLSQYGALGVVLTISLLANGFLLLRLIHAFKDQVKHVKEITKVISDSNFALATINSATEQRAHALDRATEAIQTLANEVRDFKDDLAGLRDLAHKAMDSHQRMREALIRSGRGDITL